MKWISIHISYFQLISSFFSSFYLIYRELATQIHEVISKICQKSNYFQCILFVGGTSITDNYHQYSTTGGNIITGTPGRILDFKNRYNDIEQKHHQQQNQHHHNQSNNNINNNYNIFRKLEVLILDEADTLLDMGFKETINQILEYLPKQRRTGLFSATQNKEVRELIRAGLRNPCLISVKVDNNNNNKRNNNNMKINTNDKNNNDKKNITTDTPNTNSDDKIVKSSSSSQSIPTTLDNYYIISEHENRVEILLSFFLQHRHEKIIVFCATCACVEYYSYFYEKLFKDKLLSKSYRSDNNDDSNYSCYGDSDNDNNNDENKRCFTSNDDYKTNDSSSNTNCNSGISCNKSSNKNYNCNDNNNDNNNNNNNKNNNNNNNSSNCNYQIISFHGKMIPKKRNALYKKFVKMTTGGVMFSTDVEIKQNNIIKKEKVETTTTVKVIDVMKEYAMIDRTLLEYGSTAFMSYLRAYKEHLCSYIFRFDQLDIGMICYVGHDNYVGYDDDDCDDDDNDDDDNDNDDDDDHGNININSI